jgi:hypothetical protein
LAKHFETRYNNATKGGHMAQEPYIKGTICVIKGTKKEVKILGQVQSKAKDNATIKQKSFVYEVEYLSKKEKEENTQYRSEQLQAKSMGFHNG